ncbi:MAG: hypothetical protein D6772_10605 [Bacteroidetes bacterium]|nr:MAG: hypothetical protein D6772_10605 [Bacteroidota bacterium]
MRQYLMFFLLLALLAACREQSKVMTSPNGYEYVLHKSTGGETPAYGDVLTFHVDVRQADSVLFSTRQGDPVKAPLQDPSLTPGQQSDPVLDVLPLMAIGDSLTVTMKLDSLAKQTPGFEDVDEIYYDIVLLDIQTAEEAETEAAAQRAEASAERKALVIQTEEGKAAVEALEEVLAAYKADALGDKVQTTETGLQYIIHTTTSGKPAEPNKNVSVNYLGMTPDGNIFDESYTRGQPISFTLGTGRVIPGWDEGIDLLKVGEKATLIIPGNLAYGPMGSPPNIGPNETLFFYVSLEDVQEVQ